METEDTPERLPAIDVHAHYGNYVSDNAGLLDAWLSCNAEEVVRRATASGIVLTVASPLAGLLPRGQAETPPANLDAARAAVELPRLGQWVILHPDQPETFEQAEEMLGTENCFGIKLHPEEHCYPVKDRGRALFEFAARYDATVLVHSGDPNSWPADFVPFADEYPNIRIILAHLGNGGGAVGDPTLQVRAIQSARHDNLLVDTSSSRSILPGLVEWAVKEIGAERILFGTDTPLYSVAMQRARIESADISTEDKRRILYDNACLLLGITPC